MGDTFRYFCRSVACLWLILVKCLRQESFSLSTLFIKTSTIHYTFILTQVMNIHVTGCLLNNDNFHKTMKKK